MMSFAQTIAASPTAEWAPDSWKKHSNPYQIAYDDQTQADETIKRLQTLPSLVPWSEVLQLKTKLKDVALGRAFILQGGDCAELFEYCNEAAIARRTKLLLQLSFVFSQVTNMPTITIGRIAGQYGKPRNGLSETINGKELPKFYGDVINGNGVMERQPNPSRLIEAYSHASSTLNYLRAQHMHGDADKSSDFDWAIGSDVPSRTLAGYNHTTAQIEERLHNDSQWKATRSCMYTSHEALYLHYEQALTRPVNKMHPGTGLDHISDTIPASHTAFFNSSAHFVWIGDKTRQLAGAHVEYFRGLANPIGVKLGPSITPSEIIELLDVLDPYLEIGKVTLITRFGAKDVMSMLAPIIQAVQASNHIVVWQCDPMHGNTRTSAGGMRTRDSSAILSELSTTIVIHARYGSNLGGIHLEMTGDDIVECVGGPPSVKDGHLGFKYETKCDPRLNSEQALMLVYLAAREYKDRGRIASDHPLL